MAKIENFVGSDCSGSSGATDRTLTLGNTSRTNNDNCQVFVNNSFLHLSIDYTIEHNVSGTVITFLNRVWDNQSIATIYNVEEQTLREHETENYDGSDATGSDGDSDRTLTISNTLLTTQDNFQVFVNNSFLHLTTDYTVSHNTSSTVITFLNALFDNQSISVKYSLPSSTISQSARGILPLDTQYINNEINYYGDSVVIRASTKLDEDDRGNSQTVLGDSKVSYTSGDDALGSFYGDTWIAQNFTTSSSTINATSIKLKVKRTGTPGAITVSIKAIDGDSKPTGSDLTSGTLDYTDLIADAETGWIVLPLSDYTLSASTTYSLVIRASGGDNSNKYESRMKTTGTYSGGNNLTSSNAGSSWTTGTADLLFDLYGDTNAVAMVDVLTMDSEGVKSGKFQSGDIMLNFQNAESNIERGTRIKYRNLWYKIDELEESSLGNVSYFLEAIARKI